MNFKEKFIIKANKLHNNKYNYSETIYSSQKDTITIGCPLHGNFNMNAKHHVNGGGCPKCRKERLGYNTENFIKKAQKAHGDKFDYSLAKYEDANTKVKIICPKHGEFEQTPGNHLFNKHGCWQCAEENAKILRTNTTESFIKSCEIVHNFKYDYFKVDYKLNNIPIIITCPIHGDFNQIPANHISGMGCIKCRNEKYSKDRKSTTEIFIKRSTEIHKGKYDYSLVEYENQETRVKIICPIHGIFTQEAYVHLRGSGCKHCAQGFNTFRKSEWIKKAGERGGIFYIIKCFNEEEEFYKLGITYKSVKFRYRPSMMPYKWETILEIKSQNLNYIWELESINKSLIAKYRYKPKIYFEGCVYEAFSDLKLLKLHTIEEFKQLENQ